MPVSASNSTAPSRAIRPASGRSTPSSRRSRVDLPEPLGPATSTVSPSSDRSMRSSSGPTRAAMRASSTAYPGAGQGRARRHPAQDEEEREGDRDHHQREGLGRPQVRFHGRVHGEGERLRAAGQVSGEKQRGAEFPQGPRPAHRGAGDQPGGGQRQPDAQEGAEGRGAQRARDDEQVLVHAPERGDARLHEERGGDEGLGHHHCRRGERYRDPVRGQPAAEQTPPAEREQEADSGDRGRNHRRQLGDGFQPARCPAGVARDAPGEQRAEHHHQRQAGAGGQQRQAQRGDQERVTEPAYEVGPGERQDQGRDRQEEESDQGGRRDQLRRAPCARAAGSHLRVPGWNPKRTSLSCPAGDSSRSTNSRASPGSLARSTTATGYSAITFNSAGMRMTSTSRPAAAASVRYTMAASASPSATFESTWRTFISRETTRDSTAARNPAPYCADAASRMRDRKSTRLNSSHSSISYAVFCLKKKKNHSRITKLNKKKEIKEYL